MFVKGDFMWGEDKIIVSIFYWFYFIKLFSAIHKKIEYRNILQQRFKVQKKKTNDKTFFPSPLPSPNNPLPSRILACTYHINETEH